MSLILKLGNVDLVVCTAISLGFLQFTGTTCHRAGEKGHDLRNLRLTPAIEMRADEAGLDDLRTTAIGTDDLEVRIWKEQMTAVGVVEGYVLKRSGTSWHSHRLLPMKKEARVVKDGSTVVVTPPVSAAPISADVQPLNGWEFLWKSLTDTGLLTLPDEGNLDLRASKGMAEGIFMYVVELGTHEGYRTYRYTAPERFNRAEAKAMVRIIQILHDEFSNDQQQ